MAREIVSAQEWHKRIDQWSAQKAKANGAENKSFTVRRPELSVADLRDQTIGIIHSTYGKAGDAFINVYQHLGPHPSTLRSWEDRRTLAPRMTTLRAALRACGYDLGVVNWMN
jgi:hypothetical protein